MILIFLIYDILEWLIYGFIDIFCVYLCNRLHVAMRQEIDNPVMGGFTHNVNPPPRNTRGSIILGRAMY